MKRKYENLELEIILVESSDVITTSPGTEGPVIDPDANNTNPFGGGYDPNGWT